MRSTRSSPRASPGHSIAGPRSPSRTRQPRASRSHAARRTRSSRTTRARSCPARSGRAEDETPTLTSFTAPRGGAQRPWGGPAGADMATSFDVVVIGAGPAGYIAAIRAAQLGFSTACIDEWKNEKGGPAPGGTCTNIGCIPSKALLQSSENFDQAGHHFADHGIGLTNLSIDVPKMMARKKTVVKQNNDGILYLFKKNKVAFFHGRGSFARKAAGGWDIAVAGAKPETISGKHVVVATGSHARALPGASFDEKSILSNDAPGKAV